MEPVLSQKQIQGMEIPLPYLYLSGDTKDLVDERDLSYYIICPTGFRAKQRSHLVDERDLSYYIIPIDILDLSFADHRHRFVRSESPSSRMEGAEP